MTEPRSTIQAVAAHLSAAVGPLRAGLADLEGFRALLLRLGWEADTLPQSYLALDVRAAEVLDAAAALDEDAGPEQVAAALDAIGALHTAVRALGEAPAGVEPGPFLAEFGERLFELLLVDYLGARMPTAYIALRMLEVITLEVHAATPTRPAFTRTRFRFDEMPRVIADPRSIPARVYGWGTPDLDFTLIANHLYGLSRALGLPATVTEVDPVLGRGLQAAPGQTARPISVALLVPLFGVDAAGVPTEAALALLELPGETGHQPGVILQPLIPSGIGAVTDLGEGVSFRVRAGTDLAATFGIVVRPSGTEVRFPFQPGTPPPSAGFGIALVVAPESPALLVGVPDETRLQVGGRTVALDLDVVAGEPELRASLALDDLLLVIAAGDQDGFLGGLLGGDLTVPLPLVVVWSSRTGLTFGGSAGLAVAAHPHREIGPVRVDEVSAAVRAAPRPGGTAELELTAGVGLSGTLGPIGFVVDGIGLALRLLFADGNAGPLDVAVGFQPPTGLGLVIDAGPVRGGGFIGFEPDRGRYVGVVELDAYEIEISAIAILDTRDTTGRDLPAPGFSFLMIVAVELPPIQLGFGFTLNGVGGLVGINRRLDAPALLAGVRSGAVDAILFPDDPVRDAPVILGHLNTILPVAVGRHVFAPMALIGWGTPKLIDIELAVVLEVPAPVIIALIGQASLRLPDDPAVVVLNVDVVGILDVGKGLFSLDASLRESRVTGYPLTGDLAMRLAFGGDPSFALGVGGLNPHFEAPPGFPTLRRVTVALGNGDNPRVSIEGYLAVTSNSLQFGAKAELYAEAGGVNVKGWLGFDALFVFEPFSFTFDFSAGMSLNRGSHRIAGITVDGTLTGPNPFHAWGKGCLSLLFFDICVPFDATFGARRDQPELPPADPWAPLRDAIARGENWSAELPAGGAIGVALRPPAGADVLLLHPMGVATLRQRVVPLNRTLERFGRFPITGPDRFDVVDVRIGSASATSWQTVTEHFAPGEVEALSPTEQLSRDSFERMDAGVSVGTDTANVPAADEMKTAPIDYETRVVDAPDRIRHLPSFRAGRLMQLAGASTGAKARSPRVAGGAGRFAREDGRRGGVRLEPERYAVATKAALTPRADIAAGVTRGAAYLALKRTEAATARGLQVVPDHELEVA
jgi:hypothetical protein